MATATITSSSAASISNVTNNTASSASILPLSSSSRTSSAGSTESIPSGSLSSGIVSSSSSRSRRSKISNYYHGTGGGSSNISSTTAFPNLDTKSMLPSSNVSSSFKASHHTAGGSSDTASKTKSGQRRWKEDSNCKSKGLKWKTNSDVGASEETTGRGFSKAAKWKANEKSKILTANLYKMRGLKWKAFTDRVFESDEELRQISEEDDETVLRLDQSDMGLYGLCPETDPFYAVICDICNAVVKPQGLQKHLAHRHHSSQSVNHNSQNSISQHRNVFSHYDTVSSSALLDRSSLDHSTSTQQPTAVLSIVPMQMNASERNEKSLVLCKSSSRDSSPGRSHSTQQQGPFRPSGSSSSHFSSSSSSSKSKSKSTSKVKSKSGKSGKSKSGGSSSNHSSTIPSSSCSSSSSYSSSIGCIESTSAAAANAISSSPLVPASTSNTPPSHSVGSLSKSSHSTSTFSSNKSTTATTSSASQSPAVQKNLRPSGSVASTSSSSNSPYSSVHSSQSSPQNNIASSKACSSTPSKHSSITHNAVTSPRRCSTTSPNINSTVTSSVNAPANDNASKSPATSRRTYGRSKSSSVERKTVPVKEREYDANKHCGVISGEPSRPCTRSLTCKAHSLSMRRMVSGRSKSFDKLLADHRATKEQPPSAAKSRAMPELESSNSSSSIDLDRRSLSSNSNLSVEVQASSTASSQSSAASAIESSSCARKQPTPPPLVNPAVARSNPGASSNNAASGSSNREAVDGLNDLIVDESTGPAILETVETVSMGDNDNTIQININREGSTQSVPSVANRRNNASATQSSGGNSEESHTARITTRVIDTSRASVPPELLDDSKFATNIFSPESTVLTGPIRLLAEDENSGSTSKRSKMDSEPEPDISNLSEEKKLQLLVQRKVNKKNKVLFRDPNRPSPSAITIPPAAEIVAQAFAEENPSLTLTDAQFVMDPETNVVSVSVCGTFNPDNMQLNWAPFNQDFVNNTLSQALSPYGITVPASTPSQPEQPVYGNPNLMPNPEEEGFQIHHLPPLTEEEYNQMRPEFINGMPKPSMIGCPGIKSEIKEEIDDDLNRAALNPLPILPLIKQEGIKVEIKQEPLEEETSEDFETSMNTLNVSNVPPLEDVTSNISRLSTTMESTIDISTLSESVPDWAVSLNSFNPSTSTEVLVEKTNQSCELMSLDIEEFTDGSYIECLQPILSVMSRSATETVSVANGKENSNSENDDRSLRYLNHSSYSSDDVVYRSGSNSFFYGRLPKPNYVNTFGLVKLRGSTNFKKSILCTRRANSSIHAYQTLFQGGHSTFFRRDNTNTLGSKHCTVDSNGAISLNGSGAFDAPKGQTSSSPGSGSRNNCASVGNSGKITKQTRRQNSGNSPNSLLLKRQASNFASSSTQTPPSSPFYKRHNSVSAGNKVRLQKRSIIMHFRGNGSSQQHLSKTCAILQSQIVHKLAEQLLGFKKNGIQRNDQSISSASSIKMGTGKQPLQQNHHSTNNNCKLPSCSLVPSLMYQSTSIESSSLQPGFTSALSTLSSALSSSPVQQNLKSSVKQPRTSVTVAACSPTSSFPKVTSNASLQRVSTNQVSQIFPAVTPVAIVNPLITQHHLSASVNPSMQTNSSVSLANCRNANNHQGRGRNLVYRQNSVVAPSTSASLPASLNGIASSKTNCNNNSAVN